MNSNMFHFLKFKINFEMIFSGVQNEHLEVHSTRKNLKKSSEVKNQLGEMSF